MQASAVYSRILSRSLDGNWVAIECQEAVFRKRNLRFRPQGMIAELTAEPAPQNVVLMSGIAAGFFGTAEQEACAAAIVLVCSENNAWREFTRAEVFDMFAAHNNGGRATFAFDQLRFRGLVYSEDSLNFRVTTGFLERLKAP